MGRGKTKIRKCDRSGRETRYLALSFSVRPTRVSARSAPTEPLRRSAQWAARGAPRPLPCTPFPVPPPSPPTTPTATLARRGLVCRRRLADWARTRSRTWLEAPGCGRCHRDAGNDDSAARDVRSDRSGRPRPQTTEEERADEGGRTDSVAAAAAVSVPALTTFAARRPEGPIAAASASTTAGAPATEAPRVLVLSVALLGLPFPP